MEQIGLDVREAIEAGGKGTPHTIVMVGDQQGVINGAQPYEVVKQIVEGLLNQIEGGEITVQ
jgi:predicted DsbA family dithiol-disulfide isomerase